MPIQTGEEVMLLQLAMTPLQGWVLFDASGKRAWRWRTGLGCLEDGKRRGFLTRNPPVGTRNTGVTKSREYIRGD